MDGQKRQRRSERLADMAAAEDIDMLQTRLFRCGLGDQFLFEGRIVRELAGDERSEERILSAAFNRPDEEAAACAPVEWPNRTGGGPSRSRSQSAVASAMP